MNNDTNNIDNTHMYMIVLYVEVVRMDTKVRIQEDQRILIAGCRRQDLQAFFDKKPEIRNRFLIWTDDQLDRKNLRVPKDVRALLFRSYISHPNRNKVLASMPHESKETVVRRSFSTALELKLFVESLYDEYMRQKQTEQTVPAVVEEVNLEAEVSVGAVEQNETIKPVPPRPGQLSHFLLQYGISALEGVIDKSEVSRLRQLALEHGIETSEKSIDQTLRNLKKKFEITPSAPSTPVHDEVPELVAEQSVPEATAHNPVAQVSETGGHPVVTNDVIPGDLDFLKDFADRASLLVIAMQDVTERNKELGHKVESLEAECVNLRELVSSIPSLVDERNQLLTRCDQLEQELKRATDELAERDAKFAQLKTLLS